MTASFPTKICHWTDVKWAAAYYPALQNRRGRRRRGDRHHAGIAGGYLPGPCLARLAPRGGDHRRRGFCRVTQWGTIGSKRLHPDAVRQIVRKRAAAAGIEGSLLEPITPHGVRAGFITTAYRNGVSDEEIMGHSRHRSLTTMRSYVRRAKLGKTSPSGKLGL